MSYQITFYPDCKTVSVAPGTTILQAQIQAGLRPDAPCGGKGVCGKCQVMVLSGPQLGTCLSCQTEITGDMTVQLPGSSTHQVLQSHLRRSVPCQPGLTGVTLTVVRPSLEDARSDWERLQAAAYEAGLGELEPSLESLSHLHQTLKESQFKPYLLLYGNKVLHICATPYLPLLAAFDIGTTSVVCYLMDGVSGETLHIESMLNHQVSYGADVISRAEYATKGGLTDLTSAIRQEMNQLMGQCCAAVGRSMDQIALVSVAGNTCMHHLFAGIQPAALLVAPYFPEIRQAMELPASQCGLQVGPGAVLRLLPNIAGFVGADTTAAMLATEFQKIQELTLLLDIGTNGELVLGDGQRRVACSTAAGPALEGATIACGMRGAAGAIDHVYLEGGDIRYTTIGGQPAVGICGSGLIDLIAVLLKSGVLTRSGRFAKGETLANFPALRRRLFRGELGMSFLLAEGDTASGGKQVILTQKDVREVQLAKGAIAAGILLMCQTLGTTPQEIQKVYIAGAFGNYMDAENACAIGMLPEICPERIVPVGNAAGAGAQLAALSREEFFRCDQIARETDFLELALEPSFQGMFIKHLDF